MHYIWCVSQKGYYIISRNKYIPSWICFVAILVQICQRYVNIIEKLAVAFIESTLSYKNV